MVEFLKNGRIAEAEFDVIGADHLWQAVVQLSQNGRPDGYSKSTDYLVVLPDGTKLEPKPLFGLAASDALGMQITGKHFTGGVGTRCFRTLERYGYRIIQKLDTELAAREGVQDLQWAEGEKILRQHLRFERLRSRAAVSAKKAKFLQEHGRLFCERCQLDPVEKYGPVFGDACMEIHHQAVAVTDMEEGLVTRLEDLQILCACCHRVVHKETTQSIS